MGFLGCGGGMFEEVWAEDLRLRVQLAGYGFNIATEARVDLWLTQEYKGQWCFSQVDRLRSAYPSMDSRIPRVGVVVNLGSSNLQIVETVNA